MPSKKRTMTAERILKELKSLSNPEAVAGMTKYGINPKGTLGVSLPKLRTIAKMIGRDHNFAQRLWSSGIHEARILAALVDDPAQVTERQMELWVKEFDSWDVCDQCCGNLFDKTKFAEKKAVEWSSREEQFVKRASFVLIASIAIHNKKAEDEKFIKFLPLIKRESEDERNFVKKAVNWALRQIGKRNLKLNKKAVEMARSIQKIDSKSAKWIASDALRELTSEAIIARLKQRAARID